VAKIKFNVKGVETRSGYGEPIPKGMYKCDIETCVVTKPEGKDERIEVVYVIADGDHKGRKLFDYINLESEAAAFKVREFLEAVGIVTDKKEMGSFEPEKLVGDQVMIRVAHQADTRPEHAGEIQSRVGSTHKLGEGDYDEAEDLDGEKPEAESDDEDEDEVDLDELDRAELKKFIKEQELDISVKKSMSDDDIRKAIVEATADDEAEEPEADDEDEDDEDEIDLDELDRAELKKLIKERELEIKVTKGMSDDDIRKKIAEAVDDDEDDDDEAADYGDLSLDDLKATLKERGLSEKGTKKIMIARLEKDDEASKSSKDPF
jgi:hypothetical protein